MEKRQHHFNKITIELILFFHFEIANQNLLQIRKSLTQVIYKTPA